MNTYQEPKYEIKGGRIHNRQSKEQIPDDEPLFILRARDRHAAATLLHYATLVTDRQQREAVKIRAAQFSNWAALHALRMHEPDSQLDSTWTSAGTPTPPGMEVQQ